MPGIADIGRESLGVPVMRDPMAHIRDEIMAQPAAEQVEYAMDLIGYYLAPVPAFFEGCAELQLEASPADLRMLFALDRRRGRFVSIDSLLAARCLDRPCDEWGSDDMVIKGICALRKALAALELPVEIRSVDGLGYALTAGAGFTFEAFAPPSFAMDGVAPGQKARGAA
jgi:hypothetical protein